jgi:hypothetical protein
MQTCTGKLHRSFTQSRNTVQICTGKLLEAIHKVEKQHRYVLVSCAEAIPEQEIIRNKYNT